MVVCSTAARFKYPFAQLGLTPELGSSKLMPLHVGLARTKEIMFVGGWFGAARALELGLCNKVVEPGELMGAAAQGAEEAEIRPLMTMLGGGMRRRRVPGDEVAWGGLRAAEDSGGPD